MDNNIPSRYRLYKFRRDSLREYIQDVHPDIDRGVVVLFGDFENERHVFRQESSFYYLTGVTEPGAVLFSYLDGRDVIYVPQYATRRDQWLSSALTPSLESAAALEVHEVKYLGQPCKGYSISPYPNVWAYQDMLQDLGLFLQDEGTVFSLMDSNARQYYSQVQRCQFLYTQYPVLRSRMKDVASVVHHMRRFKDQHEINLIYKAVQITSTAHEVAASVIAPSRYEHDVQAQIEHVFTLMGAKQSFPSIVAGGKNSTVLHYVNRDEELREGDLVVVDIGAEYGYYAADLTRTYPVSGAFTPRQREIYNIVLATQEHIEGHAKPGMYLNNPQEQDKSLHHLAIAFLERAGYAHYFPHGIGHFLGLDVHDTGDVTMPLEAGDVITIEPGIYIPEERLGVRIEDDFAIVDDGCVCLSAELPRSVEEIEALMAQHK